MVQQRMDIINLCDSDDDVYPLRHQRSGRDENDAISLLSSDDDDSIVVVGTSPPASAVSLVARNRAGVSQPSATANQIRPISNAIFNIERSAARSNDTIQHENPSTQNQETTLQEPSFPQANTTVQQQNAAPAQANDTKCQTSFRSSGGWVGDSVAANQEATIYPKSEAANDSPRVPLHVPDTGARVSVTIPPTKKEDLPSRPPERPCTFPNVQNNENKTFKRDSKTEEEPLGQPGVHARCTSRFQSTSSDEDKNVPESASRVDFGGGSPGKVAFDTIPPRQKIRARKTVARAAESGGTNSEDSDDEGEAYIQRLLARRMKRHYGANYDDNDDSSDDGSDLSSYDTIPKNAFSSPNPDDNHADSPSAKQQLGENVAVEVNVPESSLIKGENAGQEEHSILPQVVQIPLRNNNGILHGKRVAQDVSDIRSGEDRAKGGIGKLDDGEIDSGSTGSIEGPVEPIHQPGVARRRRIILEDEESAEMDEVTQTSDGDPLSEKDDFSLADLTIDKGFHGGVDEFPGLREQEKLEDIERDLFSMRKIEHLCSLGLNKETSLPTYKFSVHNKDDTIIYDFDVRVDKSGIPNAGRGVFLHFIGARELKPSRKAWGKNRKGRIRELPEPLPAIYPHGLGVTVKLKGEKFPDPPKKVRIGSKRIYTEADYVPAPQRTFSSLHCNCGTIELGQYGPFRPEDLKFLDLFDVKSFLFSNIPNEWGFDVKEELEGKNQIIDITDEVTGDTHEAACRHIPMYVNEVGHDEKLKQTVCAVDKDFRNVVYNIVIREPMTPGETVELLVAYEGFYEEVRERKGYGLKNMKNETQSDDHCGTFLQREYAQRKFIKDLIVDFDPDDIDKMMDWLQSTHSALAEIVNSFLDKAKPTAEKEDVMKRLGTTPLAQQIVALRRFEWIAKLFEQNLKRQERRPSGETTMITDLLEGISKLKWSNWKDLIVVLSRLAGIKDANGKSLHAAFEREVVSELCYDMGDHMITSPMVEGFWCSLAMSLTKDLCMATAKEIWERKTNKTSLMHVYVQLAKDAVGEILVGDCLEKLSFVPIFKGDCSGLASDVKQKLKSMRALASNTAGKTSEVLSVLTQSDTVMPLDNAKKLLVAIPRAFSGASTVQVDHSWYICWQVLYLIESFARTHLKGSTYTLTCLCHQIGIDADTTAIMKAALEKRFEAQQRRAKKRKASLSRSGKPEKKQRKKSASPGKQMFFWSVTWNCLKEKCGWRLEVGHRPKDFYFFPPGVTRKNGSNRKHFFDSVKQVRDFIAKEKKWKENLVVKSALVEEEKCTVLYAKLKGSKKLPSFQSKEEMIDWLRMEVKNCKT